MKYSRKFSLLAFAICLNTVTDAQATEEGVFFDPVTGNYTVRYIAPADNEGPEMVIEGIFFPDTKIDPVLTSIMEFLPDGKARYGYSVTSALTSRQPLIGLGTPCEGYAVIDNWETPAGWQPIVNLSNQVPQTRSVAWLYRDLSGDPELPPTKGLAVGAKQTGYVLTSSALPGVSTACLDGHGQFNTYTDQWLNLKSSIGIQISQKMDELRRNDHVLRFAAIPTFTVPSPFNGVPLLEQIRDHVKGWPQQQLMEQVFWQQIDGFLATAISALKKGDTLAAAVNLTQLRVELRRKYPDMDLTTSQDDPKPSEIPSDSTAQKAFLSVHDQRLAAKVLDFDIDFVSDSLALGPLQSLDAPAPLLTPSSSTMYAPPKDFDGNFAVQWTSPKPRIAYEKDFKVGRYELEIANNEDFQGAAILYSGPLQSYRVGNLPAGHYWFRVRALWNVLYNDKPDPDVWSGYYAGPNKTEVTVLSIPPR